MVTLPEAFEEYVADVLARLVKVCLDDTMPVDLAAQVMEWAKRNWDLLWEAWNACRDRQETAERLYGLSADHV